jgi:hypothetical protein
MGKDSARDDRLGFVLVDEATEGAIVPTGGNTALPVPEGSVTVEALRRGTRRIREQRRRSSIATIPEATIDRRMIAS